MTKNKLLLLLALLMTAATGAWAQSATTHVVTQATVNTIFSGNGYTLGDAVKAGDVLDFQGTIDLGEASHSLVINKQVTIKSTTTDAVVKLHTVAGSLMGDDPGNCFVINKAGSGTTVQDIRIENTETWIFNTSNVTFTGVTMWVEDARVGSGVGHVALRYSDHVTFDGCTVYTKNNGGSSCCALTGSHDCTFKDTRFETAGNVGNILQIANSFNIQDKPADYTMNNDNISVINCTFTAESSGGLSNFQIVGGLRHRIENCTVNYKTSFGCTATASEDGIVIRNNTFTQGLSIPRASTVTGNNVTGNVTISANSATVSGTTVFPGSTITGNSILGKVTFNSYSKNNTLTRNFITSTGDYAVVMATTADANNTVQYNALKSAKYNGDEAVNLSTGSGNTISNNSYIALMLASNNNDWGKVSIAGTSATATQMTVPDQWEGSESPLTADEMTELGFKRVSKEEALAWTDVPAYGFLIYDFNSESGKAKYVQFRNGQVVYEAEEVITHAIAYIAHPYFTTGISLPEGFEQDAQGNIYVAKGTEFTVTATPAENYHLASLSDGTNTYDVDDDGKVTITMPDANLTLTAEFAENTYAVTFNPANANTIESGKATVTVGGTAATVIEGKLQGVKMGSEVKLKAKDGYKFRKVEVKKAETLPALNITNPSVGQVIGSDGKNYAYGSLPTDVTAVAKVCYVDGNGHGLALALTDEGQMNWSTAIETCAAHTPAFTGGTWKLASKAEWSYMISAAGSYGALRNGFSSVGGTNMQSGVYFSSTEYDSYYAWLYYFNNGFWDFDSKNYSLYVRPCLAF